MAQMMAAWEVKQDDRDRDADKKAQATIRKWALALVAVVGVPAGLPYIGGLAGQPVAAAPSTTDHRVGDLERKMDRVSRDLRSLAWVLVEIQDRMAENAQHLERKLDASNRAARRVKRPLLNTASPEKQQTVGNRVDEMFRRE